MKTIYVLVALLSFGFVSARSAHAVASPVTIGVEPIIGYERVQKFVPERHTKDRLTYGARVTAGIPLVSGEAEYTRGTDTEDFPAQALTTKDMDDKLKVGLRSSMNVSSLLSFQARAGGQAKRNTHEETASGVTTQTVGDITYRPYAGMGLSSKMIPGFELSGGVTVVFNKFPDMSQNEYQSTLGMRIRFP